MGADGGGTPFEGKQRNRPPCRQFALYSFCSIGRRCKFAHLEDVRMIRAEPDMRKLQRAIYRVIRRRDGGREFWEEYCDEGCNGTRDPRAHSSKVLEAFLLRWKRWQPPSGTW